MNEKEPIGCFSLILLFIFAFIFVVPLAIVALDFWAAVICQKYDVCTPQLINWKEIK